MHSRSLIVAAITAVFVLPVAASAQGIAFSSLSGLNEVPSVVTGASGTFTAVRVGDQINYSLSYDGFTSFVAQAHIHIGQRHTNGGVSVFLCDNTGTFPAPACPQGSGTVTGTITAAQVIGPAAQGVAAGDLDAVIAAIAGQSTYVNVHSLDFQSGEIRGNVRAIGF